MPGGRPPLPIWNHYTKSNDGRAHCKHCNHDCVPNAARMKQHLEKDHPSNTVAESEPEDVIELPASQPGPSQPKQSKMDTFTIRTRL